MINKIYKTINNKYLKFFKFIFFLKHVFAIFLIAILIFLLIPKFFNYEKKKEILEEYLVSNYDLEFIDYSLIKYNIFPLPNLSIEDINFKVKNKPIIFYTKKFDIFLKFENIYDYENFEARKIVFNNNKITLDIDKTKELLSYFANLKYKFHVKALNLYLKKKENSIVEIKSIYFSNYGYQKNKIKGKIFKREFQVNLDVNNKNLDFKILNTGINANLNFDKKKQKNSLTGLSKINILNNYLKFNFSIINDKLEISKANLRNEDLSISFDGLVKVNPFFEIYSNINIDKIDKKLINSLNLEKILQNKSILKKFNSNFKIDYSKKKRLWKNLIENHSSEFNLAYGNLTFLKETSFSGVIIKCKGNSSLIEEYPRLNFQCFFDIKDRKKFFKNFIPSRKIDKVSLNLNVNGSLNLLKKKINFEKININNNYIANEEDIIFFKETFERILLDESFFEMFNVSKIKEFLLEVI